MHAESCPARNKGARFQIDYWVEVIDLGSMRTTYVMEDKVVTAACLEEIACQSAIWDAASRHTRYRARGHEEAHLLPFPWKSRPRARTRAAHKQPINLNHRVSQLLGSVLRVKLSLSVGRYACCHMRVTICAGPIEWKGKYEQMPQDGCSFETSEEVL